MRAWWPRSHEARAAPDPETGAWQSPGWFGPKDIEYKYAGGTSMATPIAAGGAAIVRQYYQSTSGHSASAALVKGTLINSADDLLDENNDGSDDNDIPIPNNHEGWGRINLDSATDGVWPPHWRSISIPKQPSLPCAKFVFRVGACAY